MIEIETSSVFIFDLECESLLYRRVLQLLCEKLTSG